MKKKITIAGLGMVALFSASYFTSKPDDVIHHGQSVNSLGDATYCLRCHDGNTAPSVPFKTMIGDSLGPHPVSRDYPPMDQQNSYNPPEQINASGIPLINGQISCISCHNLKLQNINHLIEPYTGKNLCLSCHIK